MGAMIKTITFNDHLLCASYFTSFIPFNPHDHPAMEAQAFLGAKDIDTTSRGHPLVDSKPASRLS